MNDKLFYIHTQIARFLIFEFFGIIPKNGRTQISLFYYFLLFCFIPLFSISTQFNVHTRLNFIFLVSTIELCSYGKELNETTINNLGMKKKIQCTLKLL